MTEKVHLVVNNGRSGLAITRDGDRLPAGRGVTRNVTKLLKRGKDLAQHRREIKILTAAFSATTCVRSEGINVWIQYNLL